MKKIFTLILYVLAGLCANMSFAQSDLEAINPQTVVYGTTDDFLLTTTFDVKNNSASPINVRVRRNIISEIPGTYNYFCWEQCYTPPVSISPTYITIGPGQSVPNFYADYQPMGNAGSSFIEYCFFQDQNQINQTCVTIEFQVSIASAVSNAELGEIGLPQPNPAFDLVRFPYSLNNTAKNASITLFNLVGQQVKQVPLTGQSGMVEINVSDLHSGIYMYSFMSENQMISTGKLIVK
jgi:hypothetical protein